MWKFLLLGLLFSLAFVWWCGNTTTDQEGDIVYQTIQQSFLQSSVFSLFTDAFTSQTWIIRESLWLYSQHDWADLFSDIIMDISVYTDDKDNGVSALQFSGVLADKQYDDIFSGSGLIYRIQSWSRNYMNRNTGYISLWEGSAESFIISTILDNIKNQRLLLDDNALVNIDWLSLPSRKWLFSFISTIKSSFSHSGFMTIDTDNVGLFPAALGNSGMYTIVEAAYDLFAEPHDDIILSFQGHIQTEPDPKLIIQRLYDVNSDWRIEWYIGIRHWDLVFNQESIMYGVSWEEKRNAIVIDIVSTVQWLDIFHLSVTITTQDIDHAIAGLWYEWEVSFAVGNINNNSTNISFPIAGVYSIAIVDELLLSEPDNYILMSQLFGDEYGILRLLESE